MKNTDPATCEYYVKKCREHLARTKLSWLLAVQGCREYNLDGDDIRSLTESAVAFEDLDLSGRQAKLIRKLCNLHLLGLKANFEIFLNRILTAALRRNFPEIEPDKWTKAADGKLPLGTFVSAIELDSPQEFIIAQVVPTHDLEKFNAVFAQLLQSSLQQSICRDDHRSWHQIKTAFEVRHLIEHQNGNADRYFFNTCSGSWMHSSWADFPNLEDASKRNGRCQVHARDKDFEATYDAMVKAATLIGKTIAGTK